MFWREGTIPEPIYRILPVTYLVVGVWVIIAGEGLLALLSGLLLCSASVLVFAWRRDARKANARGPGLHE